MTTDDEAALRIAYESARHVGIPSEQIDRWLGTMRMCGFVVERQRERAEPVAYVVQSVRDGGLSNEIAPVSWATFHLEYEKLEQDNWVKAGRASIVPLYLAPPPAPEPDAQDERDANSYKFSYEELLMAVAQKWPNETRHQTALRYILEREAGGNQPVGQASKVPKWPLCGASWEAAMTAADHAAAVNRARHNLNAIDAYAQPDANLAACYLNLRELVKAHLENVHPNEAKALREVLGEDHD